MVLDKVVTLHLDVDQFNIPNKLSSKIPVLFLFLWDSLSTVRLMVLPTIGAESFLLSGNAVSPSENFCQKFDFPWSKDQ